MNTPRPLHQPLRALLLTAFCLAALLRSGPPAAAAEAFGLIGTATFPGGAFAVFDGSRGEFKAYVHPGEMIGDCRLVDVRTDRVRLATPTGEIELPMDKQLRRGPGGSWELAALAAPFSPRETPPAEKEPAVPATVAVATRPVAIASGAPPAPVSDKAAQKLEAELLKLDKKLLEGSKPPKDPGNSEIESGKKLRKQISKGFRKSF